MPANQLLRLGWESSGHNAERATEFSLNAQRLRGLNRADISEPVLSAPLAAMMLFAPARTTEERWPAAYDLTWEAPAGCPEAEQLRERIAELAPNPGGGETLVVGVLVWALGVRLGAAPSRTAERRRAAGHLVHAGTDEVAQSRRWL